MTNTARKVLSDCKIALDLLERESNMERWRVHWVGALALIRAVGHVLSKVDGANPIVGTVVGQAYARWKSQKVKNSIFWEFIEEERNNILKEYRFNVHPLDDVDVVVTTTVQHSGTGKLSEIAQVFPLDENIYRPMLEGFGEGTDARDVYQEALDWWDAELSEIEKNLPSGISIRTQKAT